jgi:hypothetical protein
MFIDSSGQVGIGTVRPMLLNTLPRSVVAVAGNPGLQIHTAVVHPAVPAGAPMFLLIGFPARSLVAFPPALLNPTYGLPGLLAMPAIAVGAYVGPAGTAGNPAYALPIPRGLGSLGHVLSVQNAVFTPGGIGLTGAIGIVI